MITHPNLAISLLWKEFLYHFFFPSALFVASTLALAAASLALASVSRLAAASSRCFLQ